MLQEGIQSSQLEKAHRVLDLPVGTITRLVDDADPTPDKQYDSWILRQWVTHQVILPEDAEKVKEYLQHFTELKRKPSSQLNRDIHRYPTFGDLQRAVQQERPEVLRVPAEVASKISGLEGVEVNKVDGPYITLRVTDPRSLGILGEGTRWCTRGANSSWARSYLEDFGAIYVVLKDGVPFMQYTPDYSQVMDVQDQPMEPGPLLNRLLTPPPNPSGDQAFGYAKRIVGGEWPEGEEAIAKDGDAAYRYAHEVLGRRFPLGEPAIAKSEHLIEYIRKFIGSEGWPEMEPEIARNGKSSLDYSEIVGPFPAGEPAMSKNAKIALGYASETLHGPFPMGEPAMAKDPEAAYRYARGPLGNKRFRLGEPAILTTVDFSYLYASHVIGGRWPKAEKLLRTDPGLWEGYQTYVAKKRLD
jgi:hypothetical protein